MPVINHALLGLSLAFLAGSALRAASLATPRGLMRVVAAVPLVAAAAGVEALLLGLAGLGTSPVALPLAAGLTWLAAVRTLPRPAVGPVAELRTRWARAGLTELAVAGIGLGVWLAWAAWLLRFPALGYDSVVYHVPEVVSWVHEGNPGTVETILPGVPVGNYPLTNEVLLAWGSGIARSYVVIALWAPALLMLLALSGWAGLRELGVPRVAAVPAVAAMCLTPVLTHYQMNGAHTDLPALSWLVCAGALCAGSARRPGLLVVALVAAGLAVGTKTTVLPLAVALLALTLATRRSDLPSLKRGLVAGSLLAAAVALVWPLRNLVDHGSPFWPFFALPWGDPSPEIIERVGVRFFERPGATIREVGDDYLRLALGGIVLLVGAALAAAVSRSRAALAAAAVATASLVLWMATPLSGIASGLEIVAVSSLRYLLPAFAAAALALCLAARVPGAARVMAVAVLSASAVVGGVQTLRLGFPSAPAASTVVAGALVGAGVAVVGRASVPRLPETGIPSPAIALTAVATAALLAVPASGFVKRHAATKGADSEITAWAAGEPEFEEGDAPIAMDPLALGVLSGDRMQHRLELIGRREPCSRVQRRLRTGWVVQQLPSPPRVAVTRCARGAQVLFAGRSFRVLRAR